MMRSVLCVLASIHRFSGCCDFTYVGIAAGTAAAVQTMGTRLCREQLPAHPHLQRYQEQR